MTASYQASVAAQAVMGWSLGGVTSMRGGLLSCAEISATFEAATARCSSVTTGVVVCSFRWFSEADVVATCGLR